MMRSGYVVVLLGALIIGWSIPADAQNTPFKYQFTPYVWLSGLKGDVGARNQTASVNASFNDLLDHLDFGLMGAFEGRLGQWRILTDTLYLDVSGEKGTPLASEERTATGTWRGESRYRAHKGLGGSCGRPALQFRFAQTIIRDGKSRHWRL